MFIPLKDDNPTRSFPAVTVAIIAANVAVFMYQLSLGAGAAGQQLVLRLGAIPYEITRFTDIHPPNGVPPPFTLFSSMFLHGGVMHLVGNMLYLWIFGNNIEDILGRKRFVLFYVLCGLAAGISQVMSQPDSVVPMIGASGAVAGILGAYAVTFPGTRVLVLLFLFFFIRFLYVPAVIVLGFWFVMQILSARAFAEGVAWYAHIGGFVAGMALIRIVFRKRSFRRNMMF